MGYKSKLSEPKKDEQKLPIIKILLWGGWAAENKNCQNILYGIFFSKFRNEVFQHRYLLKCYYWLEKLFCWVWVTTVLLLAHSNGFWMRLTASHSLATVIYSYSFFLPPLFLCKWQYLLSRTFCRNKFCCRTVSSFQRSVWTEAVNGYV